MISLYEPFQPYFLLGLIQRSQSDVYIDVGAHRGVYLRLVAEASQVSRIEAFEPDQYSFEVVRGCLSKWQPSVEIRLHNLAASSKNGEIEFGFLSPGSPMNHAMATSIHRDKSVPIVERISCVSLDAHLGLQNKRVCLKIDTEGHEVEVLKGAEEILSSCSVVMQVETFDEVSALEFLEARGYQKIAKIGPDTFFSNIPEMCAPSELKNCFEIAANMLVEDGMKQVAEGFKIADGRKKPQRGSRLPRKLLKRLRRAIRIR